MSKQISFLADVEGIALFPILTLLLYGVFFLAVGWYVYKTKGAMVDRWSRIPLDSSETTVEKTKEKPSENE